MRKILLALSAVMLLASFTGNPDKTIILKDIDGTLLQSFPVIKKHNNEYTVTFTVDAMTVVTSNTDATGTHVHLVANGNSNSSKTYTVKMIKSVGFVNYFNNYFDVASTDSSIYSSSMLISSKPKRVVE